LDPYQRAVMTHIQGAVSAKTILNWQGILPNSVVRLPLTEATEDEKTIIRADLAEAGLTF
jgi:4-hydroxy-tetrahydrodipicolinate synthase